MHRKVSINSKEVWTRPESFLHYSYFIQGPILIKISLDSKISRENFFVKTHYSVEPSSLYGHLGEFNDPSLTVSRHIEHVKVAVTKQGRLDVELSEVHSDLSR